MDKQKMTTNELLTDALDSLKRAATQNMAETRDSKNNRILKEAMDLIRLAKVRTLQSQFDAIRAAFTD